MPFSAMAEYTMCNCRKAITCALFRAKAGGYCDCGGQSSSAGGVALDNTCDCVYAWF